MQDPIIPAVSEGVAVRSPEKLAGRLWGFGQPEGGFGHARGAWQLIGNIVEAPDTPELIAASLGPRSFRGTFCRWPK